MIEPLANVLKVSVPELLSGELITNQNQSANLLKSSLYVCPICGNVLYSAGKAMISCCGVTLPPLEAEAPDDEHQIDCQLVEDEYYVSAEHPMTKEHYVSFMAYCTGDRFQIVKLYPEGNPETRFFKRGRGILYWYCNRHGLFSRRV